MPVILRPEDEIKWLKHEPYQNFAYPYQVELHASNLDSYNLLF